MDGYSVCNNCDRVWPIKRYGIGIISYSCPDCYPENSRDADVLRRLILAKGEKVKPADIKGLPYFNGTLTRWARKDIEFK